MKELYSVLGFTEEESRLQGNEFQKLCKKKFRELSKIWHPDKWSNKSDEEKKTAEEKFKQINEANDVLSNPDKRQMYDATGSVNGNPNGDPFNGYDPFENFDPFAAMRGERIPKGDDIKVQVDITMRESFNGCTKTVKIAKSKPCSHCNGSGSSTGKKETCSHCHGRGVIDSTTIKGNMQFTRRTACPYCHGNGYIISSPCKHCNGTGKEAYYEDLTINIPAGVFNGAVMVNEGMGESSFERNGVNGDLYIGIHVVEDTNYQREDDNIIYTLDIDLLEAFKGCEKDVTNVDGKNHKIKIKPLTKNGDIIRIYGAGFANVRNPYSSSRGDLCVLIRYKMPKTLTSEQISLLEKFYEIENKK